MHDDLLILIVTFNGRDTIGQTLDACMCRGAGSVLILDNASADDTVSVAQAFGIPDLEILRMPRNRGVAAAFNIGLSRAANQGKKWLWVLDQDTVCAPGCLERLLECAADLSARGEKVGAAVPTVKSFYFPEIIQYPYRWTGRRLVPVQEDGRKGPVSIDSTLSSGTLYSVSALEEVDGFRENYFIDFVDHECHLRMRRSGWAIWWERGTEIHHRLGREHRLTEDGLWVEHAPYRYYYMARNMAEGHLRLGGPRALACFLLDVSRHVSRMRRYGSEPNRCILYILKGIKDAFLGRFGQLEQAGWLAERSTRPSA